MWSTALTALRNQLTIKAQELSVSPQDVRLNLVKHWIESSPDTHNLFSIWDRSNSVSTDFSCSQWSSSNFPKAPNCFDCAHHIHVILDIDFIIVPLHGSCPGPTHNEDTSLPSAPAPDEFLYRRGKQRINHSDTQVVQCPVELCWWKGEEVDPRGLCMGTQGANHLPLFSQSQTFFC